MDARRTQALTPAMSTIRVVEKMGKETEKQYVLHQFSSNSTGETAFGGARTAPKAKTMNIALWILQVLWGVLFCFTGFGKVMCYRPDVWDHTLQQPVPWFSPVPQGLFVFIGVCEFLGSVGMILPAMTGVKPKLTPFAAIALLVVMILAAAFHIARGEFRFFLPLNLVLGGVAAFIAYGRLFVRPLAPASISALRMLTGLAVLGG
ncbi:MAG: DoxX family protein [Acidobacteria bacterium]|nr:DoxX family protein [Acidobacteriota bacterium]